MNSKNKTNSVDWQSRLQNAYAIHNVTILRPELPIYLIIWDKNKTLKKGEKPFEWIDLGRPNNLTIKPQHFETYFGKDSVRDQHYSDAIAKAIETGDTVIKEIFGTYDLFHPLKTAPGEPVAVIHAGHFLKTPPDWDTVSGAWGEMTSQEATSANRDFVHYVKMVLKLPIFEPRLIKAIKEFFSLYADYILEGDNIDVRDKINELNSTEFATYWPIKDWVDAIISPNKFLPPPWHFVGALTEWMKVGIGINRLPTTAMTLMPIDPQRKLLDPVKTLLRNAQIQQACIKYARTLPETSATTLQDYGISFITSFKESKTAASQRLELRETAQKLRTFVKNEFNLNAVIGIGRSLTPGDPLSESHREAVLALHMCVQLKKNVLFFDEHGASETFRYAQIQQAADELKEALHQESSTTLKMASDGYVQLVLMYSNQRMEVVRGQFLATLFQIFNTVQRRNPMRKEARDTFINDLTVRVEETRSIKQLINSFNESIQRLSFVLTRAWRGPSVMLMEATLQYIQQNYFEVLKLPDVAKKSGFSVPVFTRVFKQATGMSYLSYLRQLRVEHAKKLLANTSLTLAQVAQSSGLNSQHHLIRSFKQVTNMTPGSYRKNNSNIVVE